MPPPPPPPPPALVEMDIVTVAVEEPPRPSLTVYVNVSVVEAPGAGGVPVKV